MDWFSTLMWWTFKKMDLDQFRAGMKAAIAHHAFAMTLCRRQFDAGRKFDDEHTAGASSWG